MILALILSTQTFANGTPLTLKVKVYKIAVSTDKLCSDPITILSNDNPDYTDMLDNPTIANTSLADGTYNCMMIEMSDLIKFTPDTDQGAACTANTEYTLDVCHDGNTTTHIDGTSHTCSGGRGTEELVTLHLSTGSAYISGVTAGNANAWEPPTSDGDSANGFNLSAALVVSGATSGVFYIDGSNQVSTQTDGGTDYCEMEAPVFGFR
jgi:hypothetical protein